MTNNYKWDLSKLYTGYDDPIFLKDYDQLVNYKIENVNTNTSFKQLEEIKDLEYRLRLYVTLRLSVEANNEDAILWSSKVLSACAVAANQMNELWTKILEDKEIKQSSGSLTLAHSQYSQMSFMYGFFFVKFLFLIVVCVVIVI